MHWILLERKSTEDKFSIVGSTEHEELASEFTEFEENPNRKVVSSELTQAEARMLARDVGGIATTLDNYYGKWESTHQWIVVLNGNIVAGLEEKNK